MTPPEVPVTGPQGRDSGPSPAVSVCAPPARIDILRQRADFLRAASGRRQGTPGFLLQARPRRPDEPVPADLARVGFTCSKKVGNAVARNRAKRRLRENARLELPDAARAGWDYVLVGRPEATATRDFAALLDDLRRALTEVHSDKPRKPRPEGQAPRGPRRGRG
jgi:ribonuclease P protein component